MKNDNCIFCKIANGEIPSNTIYEDEALRVFLDLGPATKGHALIVPKDHYANLFEMPEDLLSKVIHTAKKVGQTQMDRLNADGFNLVQNNNEAAGQTVFHFHMHLIPRYKDDNQKILWNPTSPSSEELVKVKEILTK